MHEMLTGREIHEMAMQLQWGTREKRDQMTIGRVEWEDISKATRDRYDELARRIYAFYQPKGEANA